MIITSSSDLCTNMWSENTKLHSRIVKSIAQDKQIILNNLKTLKILCHNGRPNSGNMWAGWNRLGAGNFKFQCISHLEQGSR